VGIDDTELKDFYTRMNGTIPQIGAVSTTFAVIASVVIVSLLVLVAILLYQKYNPPSKVDFVYTNDLQADLVKYLPKDVYNRLMKENKQFQTAANSAIQNTAGLGTIKTIGYVAGAIALLFIGKKLFFNDNKNEQLQAYRKN
jgi:predicted PurR-regulated permease PerM